jgi:5-methylcytosine-specific restriction endonuclease McrA
MNEDILNKPIVLTLNRLWQATGHRTVKDAMVALNGGNKENPPALALAIDYEQNSDGTWKFHEPCNQTPTKWEDWIKLPIRDFDLVIHTCKLTIRVPTVIVSVNYDKTHNRTPKFSADAVFERDQGIDQYTGKYVPRNEGNLDHVIPKDKGGKTEWENIVWTHQNVNHKKANKLPHEAGLKLIRKPFAPKTLMAPAYMKKQFGHRLPHRDWQHFLH